MKAVGDRTRDETERRRRNELNEPDQSEVERGAGQGIDLPRERGPQQRHRHPGEKSTDHERGQVRVAENREWSDVHSHLIRKLTPSNIITTARKDEITTKGQVL